MIVVARLIWSVMPVLAVVDLFLTLGAMAVVAVSIVLAPLAPIVGAVLLGPVWLGATRFSVRAIDGEAVGVATALNEVRRSWRTGVAISLLPAAVLCLLIGSAMIADARPEASRWMVAPILADVTVLLIVAAASVIVVPLAATTSLGYRERWLLATALAGRHLVICLGLIAVPILLAVSTRFIGPVMIFVAAGPLCLFNAAVVEKLVLRPSSVRLVE